MPIAFSLVPGGIRTPGVYVEFDSSKAVRGLPGLEHRLLLIVQRLTTGTVAQAVLRECFSADDGRTFFGQGSLGHHMVERARAASASVRIFAIAMDDSVSGVVAAGSVTFSGPATAAGTLYGLVAGRTVRVAVSNAKTAAQLCTDYVAAINALNDLPVTALVDGIDPAKALITANHAGEIGNSIDLRFNYNQGEEYPSGISATVVDMVGGTGNPSISTVLAALGDEWFTDIAIPWTDDTNLDALETELDERWGPMRPIDGHAYACKDDGVANLSTFGDARNNPHVTTLGIEGSPTPTYEIAAALGAIAAEQLQRHPARPLTNLEITGVLAPVSVLRFTRAERDVLLHDGISTSVVAPGGDVAIDRLITMYRLSPAGTVDESYLDLNTMATLSYLRYTFRARMATRFERSILADDSNRAGPGQPVVTPKSARLEIIALFDEWEAAGLVTDIDQFLADLRVEINADPVRLDVLLPPNLTNPLLITAAKLEFRR